ncbi:MAG: glycerate kinase [Rhodococcus sp.]|nr:glycerate kinase [Rhodococcus sp. (in: high G+C Gram-positive bacteria)]
MRVMIAPDSFGQTLTSAGACEAIAAGWRRARRGDELLCFPQSDGGPGFVEVLAGFGGDVAHSVVSGPLTENVTASWLMDGEVAYIESAQACGLGLLPTAPTTQTARAAHSRGVGQLIAAAVEAGASTIVVGLGGSSCTDGGRGMIAALGGLESAASALAQVQLIAATDVENSLLGSEGAAHVFGPQKGADAAAVRDLEEDNAQWADELKAAGYDVADLAGAGAAGGIGAALLALGAQRESGARIVAQRGHQLDALATADLLITGEGRLDRQSLRGKSVIALGADAQQCGVATICIAGQVLLTAQEIKQAGLHGAYSLVEHAGSVETAMSDAANQLTSLAAEVAQSYTDSAQASQPEDHTDPSSDAS